MHFHLKRDQRYRHPLIDNNRQVLGCHHAFARYISPFVAIKFPFCSILVLNNETKAHILHPKASHLFQFSRSMHAISGFQLVIMCAHSLISTILASDASESDRWPYFACACKSAFPFVLCLGTSTIYYLWKKSTPPPQL